MVENREGYPSTRLYRCAVLRTDEAEALVLGHWSGRRELSPLLCDGAVGLHFLTAETDP